MVNKLADKIEVSLDSKRHNLENRRYNEDDDTNSLIGTYYYGIGLTNVTSGARNRKTINSIVEFILSSTSDSTTASRKPNPTATTDKTVVIKITFQKLPKIEMSPWLAIFVIVREMTN